MKTIDMLTRKEILATLMCEDWSKPIICKGFILIPTRRKHDSGYNMMEVVAVNESRHVMCKRTSSCDVINLLNYDRYNRIFGTPLLEKETVYRWHIDCLPKSGLLYFDKFDNTNIELGVAISDIEVKGFVSQKKNTN